MEGTRLGFDAVFLLKPFFFFFCLSQIFVIWVVETFQINGGSVKYQFDSMSQSLHS